VLNAYYLTITFFSFRQVKHFYQTFSKTGYKEVERSQRTNSLVWRVRLWSISEA